MSHGLRVISGTCGYQANGSGRDWFFVGDLGYRKGKEAWNSSASAIKMPTTQPRGTPLEIRQHRHLHGARKNKDDLKKKWETKQTNLLKGTPLPKCKSLPQYYESTYSKHGRIPGWSYPPAETAVSLLGENRPPPREFALGLGLNLSDFQSTYSDLGQIPGYKPSERGPAKHHTMSLPVFPDVRDTVSWRPGVGPPTNPNPADEATHFRSTYADHGNGFEPQSKGFPSKHHHHGVVGESCCDADKSHGATWDVLRYRPGCGDPAHRDWM
jgi:hypothetical protein